MFLVCVGTASTASLSSRLYLMLCAYLLIYDSMILRLLIFPPYYYCSVHLFIFFLFILHFRCLSLISVALLFLQKTFHFSAFSYVQWMLCKMCQTYWIHWNRKHTSNGFLFHLFVYLSAADCQRNHKPRRIKCKMKKKKIKFLSSLKTLNGCYFIRLSMPLSSSQFPYCFCWIQRNGMRVCVNVYASRK